MKKERITIYIDKGQYHMLQLLAKDEDRSL